MSDSSDIDDSSFHSFVRSKSSDDTFDASSSCLSDSDSEHAQQSPEVHTSYRTLASSSEVNNTLQSTIYNTTTDIHETSMENGDEISVVEPKKQKQKKAKKLSNWHTGSGNMCPRKLPPMPYVLPSMEAFSLDPSKHTLKEATVAGPSKQCEAEQKILYTGNWVDSQQVQPKGKLSPLKQFELVLAAYQKNKAEASTLDQPKETSGIQQAVSSNQSKPVVEEEEEKEYVSPFKDMPIQPHPKESPLLAGLKKPLVLPAGYDLSSLQVIKDPNHWSLRPGLRTGDRIY